MGFKRFVYYSIGLSTATSTLVGCASQFESNSSNVSVKEEASYCSPTTYSSSISLTGNATYTAFVVTSTGLRGTQTSEIPFAEVEVKSSNGTTVQCGNTPADGTFNLAVPKNSDTYTVYINSRANNEKIKVSILNNITDNKFFTISASASVSSNDSTKAVGTINASHIEGNIEGGAFNIFHQIYKANEYLRNNSTSTNCPTNICSQFTVAPKVNVYWTKGFNPYTYISASATDGLSFYSKSPEPTSRKLFILGGINGNTNSSDTDHFDNSVILHEYAHFLEDAYAGSDSPGGSHNGNFIIDPRLAWSEGFANFFQGAVSGVSKYQDTFGNETGSTGLAINFDLESKTTDVPTSDGEGAFREMSIARQLWDTIQTTGGADSINADISFAYLWTVFSTSFPQADVKFRNVGRFNRDVSSLVTSYENAKLTNYNSVLSNEKHVASMVHYALPVTRTGSCSATAITAVADSINYSTSPASYASNLLKSNDFYQYYHSGGTLNIQMNYSQTGSPTSDLDLYIYKDGYYYEDSASLAGLSDATYPEVNPSTGRETVNVSAPAGYYLINVRVYTAGKTVSQIGATANYTLTSSGAQLCP